ncbi:MAG: 4Fe-4S dicluster domain-containing protein [Chloroflexi bacterium]|nr:4Fe-4S dicluster domain-containing protein [Chloroflexota bacterium]
MTGSDVYADLMERLNYPDSVYLRRVLEKLLTPEEGHLLLQLPAEPGELAQRMGWDEETLNRKLQEFLERGLAIAGRKGVRLIRELTQLHDATLSSSERWVDTELLDLWREFYEADWLPRLATVPVDSYVQYVRVVPAWKAIERSLRLSINELLPGENIRELIRGAELIAVVPCSCRRSMRRCQASLDNCLQFNKGAEYAIRRGAGRRISVEEAIAIADEAEEEGLIHTWPLIPSTNLNVICNCCVDCCIIFDAGLRFGTIGRTLEKSRFRAEIDPQACDGCQDCVERCFFDAIEMKKHASEKKLKAAVDPEKCFGCGLCAIVCDPGAITMKLAGVDA